MTMAESLVHGIDHVYVPLSEAESTYRVLTERFGLPVAWPYVASGDFASGAVNLGNLNFEVLAHSDAVPGFVASSPARIQGIAFHPVATSRLLDQLDRRRIGHSPPAIFPPGATPATGAMWTNVTLEGLSNPATNVFTCDYHIPGMYDYDSRQASLDECGGGTIGLTGVKEIVISSPQPTGAVNRWQQLLDPLVPNSPGYWEFEHGPALRIIEGTADIVDRIVVTVRSLGAINQSGCDLAQVLHGLTIRFIEAKL